MTAFAYELGALIAAQARACPGSGEGAYALPWYLVVGEPKTGRSTAIKALNLSWPHGDQAVALNVPEPLCTYWLPEKAVFIEPGPQLMGPQRNEDRLYELCQELKISRSREPIDGVVLVVSLERLADADDRDVEKYAQTLRGYLTQINQGLAAEVPVYIIATGIDALWGFGDVFQWTAERRNEEPWGFSFPPALPSSDTEEHVVHALDGLAARMEAMCFAQISTEEPPERRIRAFQHLAEIRALIGKLSELMKTLAMSNAFERAPWLRAMVVGSGIPGTGQQLRQRMQYFEQLGLTRPTQSGTAQPGGMPIYALLDNVLMPERDLVPTRVRWRDDKVIIGFSITAAVMWLAVIVIAVVRGLV
jgi:type VI secretion system protein ImpL